MNNIYNNYYIKKIIFSDNIYQPSRCQEVIEQLRICCIKHSKESIVCDGINITKPYEHNTVDFVSSISASSNIYFCIFIKISRIFFNYVKYLL